jgi:hypothetical protein
MQNAHFQPPSEFGIMETDIDWLAGPRAVHPRAEIATAIS